MEKQIKSQLIQKEKKDKLNRIIMKCMIICVKKEKRIAVQNMNFKDYQNAINILHKELHKN